MLEQLKNRILYSKITGVDIIGDIKSSYRIGVVKTVYKQNKISIVENRLLESFDDLFEILDKDTPLVVSVNGRHIIHKPVDGSGVDDDAGILAACYPNFSLEEFYYQKSQIASPSVFFSIIRKETLNEVVRLLEERGLFILKICLGPFCLNSIRSFLTSSQIVSIPHYKLVYDGGRIASVDYITEEERSWLMIGDQQVDSRFVLAYAGVVDYFVNESDATISIVTDSAENYRCKSYTRVVLYTSLVFVLVILIINAAIFWGYRNGIGEIYQEYVQKREKAVELDSLRKEAQQKRDYLVKNNFVELSKTTFYVDRLSALRPAGIRFIELNVFPLKTDGVGDNGDELKFEANLIAVSGEAGSAYVLNTWLERIKGEKWVSSVTLNKIKQVEVPEVTCFSIDIKLKP